MKKKPRKARPNSAPRTARKALVLTACYRRMRDGWIVAEILESRNIYTQGRTLAETRRNLADAATLLIGELPLARLFGRTPKHTLTRAGDPTEIFVVVLP